MTCATSDRGEKGQLKTKQGGAKSYDATIPPLPSLVFLARISNARATDYSKAPLSTPNKISIVAGGDPLDL